MKAIYFEANGGPEVLQYGDVPTPSIEPGRVKVRVHACSLNYLDIFTRRGMPGVKPMLPGVTGGDVAGEIVELGAGVSGLKIGQRVVIFPAFIDFKTRIFELLGETVQGGLAEYVVTRAEQIIPIPDNVSNDQAACIPIAYGTAHRMLFSRGRLKAGETILILGASGGVGNACILLAKLAGAYVIGAAGGKRKCQALQDLGADETIDYKEFAFEKQIRKKTGSLMSGGGVDVVVNFTGGDTWAQSLRCVKRFGRILTCGATAGFDPKTDIRYIYTAEMDILGSTGFERSDIVTCLDLISQGKLEPPIDSKLPLSDGIRGIIQLEERRFFGKIVIQP